MKRFFRHLQAMCYIQSAMARQVKNATQATNALQNANCKVRQGDFSLSLSLSRLVSPLFEFKGLFLAFLLIFAPQGLKAEQSGWFVGVQGGYNKLRWEKERETAKYASTQNINEYYNAFGDKFNLFNGNDLNQNQITTWENNGGSSATSLISKDVRQQLYTAVGATDTTKNIRNVCKTNDGSTCNDNYINAHYFDVVNNILSPYWQIATNTSTSSTTTTEYTYDVPINDDFNGFTAGLLGGYKHFFGGSFGLRFYGLLDFGYYKAKNKTIENQMQSYAASFNADMLYNLYENDDFSFGVFGGLGAGLMQYMKGGDKLGNAVSFGINLGVRMNLNAHHSIEFFSKINTISSFDNLTERNYDIQTENSVTETLYFNSGFYYRKGIQGGTTTDKYKELSIDRFLPSTQVGIRYVYSF